MTRLLNSARRWALEAGDILMSHFDADRAPAIVTGPDVKNFATQVDVEIQRLIHARITQEYPGHAFVGEEEGLQDQARKEGYTWVVDPLDGTLNFYFGFPLFAVAIGALRNGVPHIGVVYDPYHKELYLAERGKGPAICVHLAHQVEQILSPSKLERLDEAIVMTHLTANDAARSSFLEGGALSRLARNARHVRMLGCGQLSLSYVARGRFHAFVVNATHPWDVVAGHVIVEAAGGVVTDYWGNPWTVEAQSVLAACNPTMHRALLSLIKEQGDIGS